MYNFTGNNIPTFDYSSNNFKKVSLFLVFSVIPSRIVAQKLDEWARS